MSSAYQVLRAERDELRKRVADLERLQHLEREALLRRGVGRKDVARAVRAVGRAAGRKETAAALLELAAAALGWAAALDASQSTVTKVERQLAEAGDA